MKRKQFPKKLLSTISTITLSLTLSLSLLLTPILTSPTLASEVNTSQLNSISLSTKTIKPTKITLNCKTITLNTGSTETLIPTISPSNATNKSVKWKSSNTKIATVNSEGLITAIKAGKSTITVTTVDNKKSAKCTVTVKTAPIATIMSISDITKTINQNDSYSLPKTVEAIMSNNSKQQVAVTWSPSTINTSKVGTYEFYGKVNGYSKQVKLTLTINSTVPPEQTIYYIPDIVEVINQNDSFSLPPTVSATMNDGSKKQLLITWNTNPVVVTSAVKSDNADDNLINDISNQVITSSSSSILNTESDKIKIKAEQKILDLENSSNASEVKTQSLSSSLIVDTSKAGTFIFSGNVNGYDKQVNLALVIQATSNYVKYFPLLSDVPMPVGVNYKDSFTSSGNAYYVYGVNDIEYSSVNTLFTANGWVYYKTVYLDNGDPMFVWRKGNSLVMLTWIGYDRVICGSIR